MTFTLSRNRIYEELYATSAMYHVLCGSPRTPMLLHEDHRNLLANVVTEAFIALCTKLLPHISDTSLDIDSDPELMWVELTLPEGFNEAHSTPLRRLMESFVASTALSRIYQNYSDTLCQVNSDSAASQLRMIRRHLSPGCDCALIPAL